MSSWERASDADKQAGRDAYDRDDPKHPDWEDLAAERADLERKREKEDGLEEEAHKPHG